MVEEGDGFGRCWRHFGWGSKKIVDGQLGLKRIMERFGLEGPFNQGHFPPDQVSPSPFDLALSEDGAGICQVLSSPLSQFLTFDLPFLEIKTQISPLSDHQVISCSHPSWKCHSLGDGNQCWDALCIQQRQEKSGSTQASSPGEKMSLEEWDCSVIICSCHLLLPQGVTGALQVSVYISTYIYI